mgnify:CR=1 FL=1
MYGKANTVAVHLSYLLRIALFTYYASDEHPIVVYGYGQFLSYDGNNVIAEEKDLFENESDLITINDTRTVSVEQHQAMYNAYYSALQDLFEHYNSCDRQVFVETVSELFKNVSQDLPRLSYDAKNLGG